MNKLKINKRGFEFSFGWIFAIMIGAVILFLAIYAVTRIAGTEHKAQQSSLAKELGTLLNPLETGLEEGKIAEIKFSEETRILNNCSNKGNFGEQSIGIMSKSSIGATWEKSGVPSRYQNKYIFSKAIVKGKEISVFSKPFEMGFKVADLMFIWSDNEKYCFVNPPKEIEEEILGLKPRDINITSSTRECEKGSTLVCFTGGGCDVSVSTRTKSVVKEGKTMYYEGALLYGAIFSSPKLYECHVKRLMERTSALAELYEKKSQNLAPLGCPSNLESDLESLKNMTENFDNSAKLGEIYNLAEQIKEKNHELECKLF